MMQMSFIIHSGEGHMAEHRSVSACTLSVSLNLDDFRTSQVPAALAGLSNHRFASPEKL